MKARPHFHCSNSIAEKGGDIMGFVNHGCGCGGSGKGRRKRNISAIGNGNLGCNPGPFRAIDVDCLPTTGASEAIAATTIPYASGSPLALVSLDPTDALVSVGGVVGFGSSSVDVSLLGTTIDLSSVINYAFAVPRAGRLTAFTAYFTSLVSLSLGSPIVRAEIYHALAGENDFSATGVAVDLPLTPLIGIGETVYASATNVNFPVAVGDRLLLVYRAEGTILAAITGTASAGLTIS